MELHLRSLADRIRGKKQPPEGPHDKALETMAPSLYFNNERSAGLKQKLQALQNIEVKSILYPVPRGKEKSSEMTVFFKRKEDGKNYGAHIRVTRDENGTNYRLEAEMQDEKGRVVGAKKDIHGMNRLSVENSMLLFFETAFYLS